jgi:hypothetical protein
MTKFNKLYLITAFISMIVFMLACSVETEKADSGHTGFASKLLKAEEDSVNSEEQTDLSFMNNAGGKYPHEINLFKNKAFSSRLQKLLKDDYELFVEWWAVEEPIKEIRPGIYWAEACKAHECAFIDFALYLDVNENYIVAGMNTDVGVEVFSEKPKRKTPKTMTDWAENRR